MGVGSSVIAATKHGRNGYGCDVTGQYVRIARERLGELRRGELKTRPMDRPVYDPSKPYGGHRDLRSRKDNRAPLLPLAAMERDD